MLWVLWDIVLPLLAAFLAGLFLGWLFWRWRRIRIDAQALSSLRKNTERFKSDADHLRTRNAELSDRLQAASGGTSKVKQTSAGASATDLAIAKKRIDTLSAELKTSRLEVSRLQRAGDTAAGSTAGVVGKAGDEREKTNRLRDLEARLQGANRKIADLEQNARNIRNDKAHPELSTSRSATVAGEASKIADLTRGIVDRDRMIETLKKSLAQYSDGKDPTSLEAEIVLRTRKIDALEAMLDEANRKKV